MVLNSSSRVGGGYQFKPNKVYFGKIVEATIPLALEQHIRGKKQAHQAKRKKQRGNSYYFNASKDDCGW